MITIEHQKEALNRAIVWAISGIAGVNPGINGFRLDESGLDYGTDGTFSQVGSRDTNRRFDSGWEIGFQLKATINWIDGGDFIEYQLCRKNYNDMVLRNNNPRKKKLMLVLFCLPKDESTWFHLDHDNMILRKSCYYTIIQGEAKDTETSSEKIIIPKINLLTPEALRKILEDLESGVLL